MKKGKTRVRMAHTYTHDDLDRVLDYVRGQGKKDLEKCILLAAAGGLRPGEICALRYEDIDGDTVHVRRSLKRDQNNKWVEGELKYPSADRHVHLPDQVTALIGTGNGRIVNMDPTTLLLRFGYAAIRSAGGLPFKSLRQIYLYGRWC